MTDIWVTFTAPYYWNGFSWTVYTTDGAHNGYTYGIWGNSSSDLYLVSHTGAITHRDGTQWIAMESGTDIWLRDIHGIGDNVFVVGHTDGSESIVLELQDGQWQTIFSSNSYYGDPANTDYGRTTAVSVYGDIAYIVSKAVIILYNYKTRKHGLVRAEDANMTGHDFIRIIVNAENDIMLIGRGGLLIHFNGAEWKRFEDVIDLFGAGNIWFTSGDLKNDTIVACGHYGGFAQAIVVRGYRN